MIARRRIKRRDLLASAGTLLAAPSIARAEGQTGVALVIGNSKYKWEASLPNVKRDAPDVAKAFQALGLRTELVQDAGREAMRAAMDKFASASRGANLAAFYFAGHGASWDKDTYLVPEDADLANPNTVQSLLPVSAVSAAMRDASRRLIVLDNCRNNPADGWRQRDAAELARVNAVELTTAALHGVNTLVLFSTAPGQVALDGPAGDNSPFAAALLRQLAAAPLDIAALAPKLRRELLIATEGRQLLWDQSTFTEPFALGGPRGAASAGTVVSRPASLDRARIVELPNAYAFARESNLDLPPGLVAIRPPDGSRHAQRVGAYKSRTRISVGAIAIMGATSVEPVVLVILSVANDTALAIFSQKQFNAGNGSFGNGRLWRFVTGKLTDNDFTFLSGADFWGRAPSSVRWYDADSGRFERMNVGGGNTLQQSERLSRLDG